MYNLLLIFVCGFVSLGVEISAARLLAPFYGTSQIVWMNVIGLILIYLAVGYHVGGRVADRWPQRAVLLTLIQVAALAVAAIPVLASPILLRSLSAFAELKFGMLIGSFFGVLSLFSIPVILLGCVSPFVIRLETLDAARSGRTTGSVLAISTLGSFLGTCVPVLVLIPAWGTRATFVFFSVLLLVLTALGWSLLRKQLVAALSLALALCLWWLGVPALKAQAIKPASNLVYETESSYQYIRVLQTEKGWRLLELNEGVGTHSAYHPEIVYTGRVWDFFSLAPYFNSYPYRPLEEAQDWAIIGAAAGTAARVITELYGPVSIQGAELDREIIRVGHEFFGLPRPNFTVSARDGRSWLYSTPDKFDVIILDAYNQAYLPFELVTREFFELVQAHLHPAGVAVMNVAQAMRNPVTRELLSVLGTTLASVFERVSVVRLPKSASVLLVASQSSHSLDDVERNLAEFSSDGIQALRQQVSLDSFAPAQGLAVFTDDHAPVEKYADTAILTELVH